jgi:hypothetical protein
MYIDDVAERADHSHPEVDVRSAEEIAWIEKLADWVSVHAEPKLQNWSPIEYWPSGRPVQPREPVAHL